LKSVRVCAFAILLHVVQMQAYFYLGILFSRTGCCAFGFPPCASLYTSYISSISTRAAFPEGFRAHAAGQRPVV